MQITRGIMRMVEGGLITLPHGAYPGTFPGGLNDEFDQARWDAYQWNPPEGLPEYRTPDPAASPKPTWAQLVEADGQAALADLRARKVLEANEEATCRIARLYHHNAWPDRSKEWQVRLSGVDITAQDAQRNRLVAACHGISNPP